MRLIFTILFCTIAVTLWGQDFVYTPKNPSFGGNTFNYQWMLSSAQAQNDLTDPNAVDPVDRFNRDPLSDFQNQLNRQILSQISSAIIGNQFDPRSGQGVQDGTYIFGNYQINIATGSDGISIFIQDNSTGNSTEVVVPVF